jgi:CheY-like chemotaxis protein
MKECVKILVIEPNKYHARLIERELSETFDPGSSVVFSTAYAALEELRRSAFDVVIMSLDLPDVDSVGFVSLIRKENRSLPIIVTADGNNSEAASQQSLPPDATGRQAAEVAKAGADEYLVKDVSFHRALPRLIVEVIQRRSSVAECRRGEPQQRQRESADLVQITARTLYHEINNPLMTILGMCELLLNNGEEHSPEVTKKIKIVKRSAQRIQTTLDKLSAIAHPTIRETASGKLIDVQKSRWHRRQSREAVLPVE